VSGPASGALPSAYPGTAASRTHAAPAAARTAGTVTASAETVIRRTPAHVAASETELVGLTIDDGFGYSEVFLIAVLSPSRTGNEESLDGDSFSLFEVDLIEKKERHHDLVGFSSRDEFRVSVTG
jgi:pantothenate kinase